MQISHIMNREVVCMTEADTIFAAWGKMKSHRIRHIPILDDNGRISGILSDRDIINAFAEMAGQQDMYAALKDYMSIKPYCCTAKSTVKEVARILIERKIDSAPVIDENGFVTGIVTSTDFIKLAS